MEIEKLRVSASQKQKLESYVRELDKKWSAQVTEIEKLREENSALRVQIQQMQLVAPNMMTDNSTAVSASASASASAAAAAAAAASASEASPAGINGGKGPALASINITESTREHKYTPLDTPTIRETSQVGTPLRRIEELEESDDEKSLVTSPLPTRDSGKGTPTATAAASAFAVSAEDVHGPQGANFQTKEDVNLLADRYENALGGMRMTLLNQQVEMERLRVENSQAQKQVRRLSSSMDETQANQTRYVLQLQQDLAEAKEQNDTLKLQLQEIETGKKEEVDHDQLQQQIATNQQLTQQLQECKTELKEHIVLLLDEQHKLQLAEQQIQELNQKLQSQQQSTQFCLPLFDRNIHV
ncbi:hypothetical protein RFI_24790 [Reticulomyxa filosa]|uniref:Viral A-type inclusion protein n=1 Tax=Reticulomyxa filosa TaxID=46433 RepID=X6MHN5_RETFI|nr:hypothetical protein RFI_24790 [Reticulomyxa filosa]|eukprot:ETO12585.1 hypothetical protein RFI_24790 [Reticulomyxa filosa]